jgi:hypothetical protein
MLIGVIFHGKISSCRSQSGPKQFTILGSRRKETPFFGTSLVLRSSLTGTSSTPMLSWGFVSGESTTSNSYNIIGGDYYGRLYN